MTYSLSKKIKSVREISMNCPYIKCLNAIKTIFLPTHYFSNLYSFNTYLEFRPHSRSFVLVVSDSLFPLVQTMEFLLNIS